DQGLGQLVTDRLEHRDRTAELDPVERVVAGESEHGARRADQLVRERPLPRSRARRPFDRLRSGQVDGAAHAYEPEYGIDTRDGGDVERADRHGRADLLVAGRNDDQDVSADSERDAVDG